MSDMKIALQMWTLRGSCNGAREMTETLKRVAKIGYGCVELAGLGPFTARDLKEVLDGEGLRICSAHYGYEDFTGDLEAIIDEMQALESPWVGLAALSDEMRDLKGYRKWARQGSEIGRKLTEAGIGLVYHNHYWEFEKHDGRHGMDVLYGESDPDVFLGQIDTYWAQFGGADPVDWIRRLAGRSPLVHFKDMGIVGKEHIMTPVGEGNLNWPSIIEASRKAGASFCIVEQDHCEGDPFDAIEISLRNLKKMGLSV